MHSAAMHFTKVPNARTICITLKLITPSSGWISTNGICGAVANTNTFARIPNRSRHKAALCLLFKFLSKKNIAKKLYIFFNIFQKNLTFPRARARAQERGK